MDTEDKDRMKKDLQAVPKKDGFVRFDLDALLNNDNKAEDKSKALQSSTNLVTTIEAFFNKLIQYSADEVFYIYIPTTPGDRTSFKAKLSLFEDYTNISIEDVIFSCDTLTETSGDPTYNEDMVWTLTSVLNWIVDPDLLYAVQAALEGYPRYSRTGPLAFIILIKQMTQCTDKTRSILKQTWLYSMEISDFPGGNIDEFVRVYRSLFKFFDAYKDDTSDGLSRFIIKLKACSNVEFSNHFNVLQSVKSNLLADFTKCSAEAQRCYTEIKADQKWNVLSTKQQATFLAQKKQATKKQDESKLVADMKEVKQLVAAALSTSAPAKPKSTIMINGKARPTHDRGGNAIDYTPPPPGAPHHRINANTGVEEWYCEPCHRYGTHPGEKHDAWVASWKKKKKRQPSSATTTTTEEVVTPSDPNPFTTAGRFASFHGPPDQE